METLPQWLTTAISSGIAAVIGFLLARRLTTATVAEKDANTLSTVTAVADSLARQLRAVEQEVPVWKQQIAEQTAVAERATAELAKAVIVQRDAKIIVEAMSHLSYLKSPDEEETSVEKRFKEAKEAAHRIATLNLDTTVLKHRSDQNS
jgi:hypothetical protein